MIKDNKNLGTAATVPEASNFNTLPEHVKNNNRLSSKTKQCQSCLERKSVSEFAKNRKTKDGYLKTCKSCIAANKRPSQSLRQAINAKCCECIYDPISGGGSWREQVTACTSGGCPLFDVRPTSRGS